METPRLPDISPWPSPAPLEGLKSRRKLVFRADAVEISADHGQSRMVGVKLTLEARVAAVGVEGRCAVELLLGHRIPLGFKPHCYEGLTVAHLGPHLADSSVTSFELHMEAIAVELQSKRPHVVVLDEARSAEDETWDRVFGVLSGSDTVKAFRGAVVFCVAQETPSIRSVCSQRWTGDAGWLWQDSFDDDCELLEDIRLDEGNDLHALLKEARKLSERCFNEDTVEKARNRGWLMSLLTASKPDGDRSLVGFICYRLPSLSTELHVARLAVCDTFQKSGCGQRLLLYILTKGARMTQSKCGWISLSSLDTAVPFYEKFGFVDMTCGDLDDPDHFQTWMELKNVSIVSE